MSTTTSGTLPGPIAAYFAAANAHDSDATVACFTDVAVVHDERRKMRGGTAIRAWKEQTDEVPAPVPCHRRRARGWSDDRHG